MIAPLTAISLGHAPLLAALHRLCFDDPWDEVAMAGLLSMPGTFGHLATDAADAPVGFIVCRTAADEAEILTLVVVPNARRRGFAQRLLLTARYEAEMRGASAMFLEVASNNTAAITLYLTTGFFEVGRRNHYYANGADALVLRCNLN